VIQKPVSHEIRDDHHERVEKFAKDESKIVDVVFIVDVIGEELKLEGKIIYFPSEICHFPSRHFIGKN
jgi:hypothetical protein